jgi:DNA-binding CsgD family transcriptional regulator
MSSSADAVPKRLRVAVSAADPAVQTQLAAVVRQCGYEIVEACASPDAMLTDGAAGSDISAPTVAVGAVDEEFAGVLPPDAAVAQIDAALRAVAAGLIVRGPPPQRSNFGPFPEVPPILLTPREIDVLIAIGDGLSNKETARRLAISPHTVKFHIESLFKKLGASSRAEAVAKGLKRQILEF